MRRLGLALALVCLWLTSSESAPLLVEWPPYQQGMVPATSLVLYRNENGGGFRRIATFTPPTMIRYVDERVKWQRLYCYKLAALTAGGTSSDLSPQGCGLPRK